MYCMNRVMPCRIRALVLWIYLVMTAPLSSCTAFVITTGASTAICRRQPSMSSFPSAIKRYMTRPTEEEEEPQNQNDDQVEIGNLITTKTTLCWNPLLRRVMASVATLGVLETAFLTYNKLLSPSTTTSMLIDKMCTGDCNSVLNGQYSTIPSTSIPISALGLLAYSLTVLLALAPLLLLSSDDDEENDSNNRIALLVVTTAMGTFSIFLLSLIYGILHTTCDYCLASAFFSMALASTAWFGGCLPSGNQTKVGVQAGIASFLATTATAVAFFSYVDSTLAQYDPVNYDTGATSTLMASTTQQQQQQPSLQTEVSPPPITTTSSERALRLSDNLATLDAKMYGAYWCSHCFDQKQALGKTAFSRVTYIECSKEGKNSQIGMCKERDVPGYPTWEINGKLYPGERELDELEDIVKDLQQK